MGIWAISSPTKLFKKRNSYLSLKTPSIPNLFQAFNELGRLAPLNHNIYIVPYSTPVHMRVSHNVYLANHVDPSTLKQIGGTI